MATLVLKEFSYKLMGLMFKTHNELGPICKEKNYQDAIEILLKKNKIPYNREKELELPFDGQKIKGFFADFVIDDKIILEVKAKRFIKHEDIRQTSRYINGANVPLGIIVNFKREKLEYKRIINLSFENKPFEKNPRSRIRD